MTGTSFAKMMIALSGPHGGTWYYRSEWGSGAVKIRIANLNGPADGFIMSIHGHEMQWTPSLADIFATDWEPAP